MRFYLLERDGEYFLSRMTVTEFENNASFGWRKLRSWPERPSRAMIAALANADRMAQAQ